MTCISVFTYKEHTITKDEMRHDYNKLVSHLISSTSNASFWRRIQTSVYQVHSVLKLAQSQNMVFSHQAGKNPCKHSSKIN